MKRVRALLVLTAMATSSLFALAPAAHATTNVMIDPAGNAGPLPASAAPAPPSPGATSYQSTDCYHSAWADPGGDAAELDAAGYAALYDCSRAVWTFSVSTYDTWPDAELDVFNIWIDADGSPSTGCGGFEWLLRGSYFAGSGQRASLIRTPSCAQSGWSLVFSEPIGRVDTSSVAMRVPNASLGGPQTIRWYGYIKGIGETAGDFIPDGGGYHRESGFAGGGCQAVPFGASGGGSYVVAGNPTVASTALESVGMSLVQSHGEGVVSFVGDPLAATKALALVGVNGPVTTDRVVGTYSEVPNDPGYVSQWALPAVNAPAAWSRTHGSSSIVVADIDSGVDATHPDLAGKLLPGFDATTGTALPAGNSDSVGHGTATAGVIGAATNNGGGLASLGWDTMILPIKVGGASSTFSAAVAGVRYAADHGARVINMSLGGPCQDPNYAAAISYAQSKGVLVVASAGNDALTGDHVNYPAAYPGVLAVGATGFDGSVALYSNFGDYVSIVAPGGSGDGNPAHDVQLLAPGGGTQTEAGTSFSAPMVSAAAADVLAMQPTLDGSAVANLLTSTATHLGSPGKNPDYGYGLLNADAAIAAATPPAPATQPAPTTTQPDPAVHVSGVHSGYWMLTADGQVFGFGDAAALGSPGISGTVHIESTWNGDGYWVLNGAGVVVGRGNAGYFGNAVLQPGERAVSLSATPDGLGYWVFTDRGRVINLGSATFFGDMSGTKLNGSVLGSVATPTGKGYWMVASDGGIFSFGDAAFHGSTGGIHLNKPVMAMAPAPDGSGYWLVSSDGGIFAFDVPFYGSMGATHLNKPIAGIVAQNGGYMMVGSDGGIFSFGSVAFHGSLGANPPASPVVSAALQP